MPALSHRYALDIILSTHFSFITLFTTQYSGYNFIHHNNLLKILTSLYFSGIFLSGITSWHI